MSTLLDSDLALILAKRLQLTESTEQFDTAYSATESSHQQLHHCATSQHQSIEERIQLQRQQRRSSETAALCPQLAHKLQLRLQKSLSIDEDSQLLFVTNHNHNSNNNSNNNCNNYYNKRISDTIHHKNHRTMSDSDSELPSTLTDDVHQYSEQQYEQQCEEQYEQQYEEQYEQQCEEQDEQQYEEQDEQQYEEQDEQQYEEQDEQQYEEQDEQQDEQQYEEQDEQQDEENYEQQYEEQNEQQDEQQYEQKVEQQCEQDLKAIDDLADHMSSTQCEEDNEQSGDVHYHEEQQPVEQHQEKSAEQQAQSQQQQQKRQEETQRAKMQRSASLSVSASASTHSDIESVGPDGEISWRLIKKKQGFNPYRDFPEFSRRQIEKLKQAFIMYDNDKDGYIGFNDLKLMMEKLGAPQTHLALKAMIKEVDEDKIEKLDFKGFLLIFKKARAGELDNSAELLEWYAGYIEVTEINVDEVGVQEAKNFFESKILLQSAGDKYKAEIIEEQRRKQAAEAAKQKSRDSFRNKRAMFTSMDN